MEVMKGATLRVSVRVSFCIFGMHILGVWRPWPMGSWGDTCKPAADGRDLPDGKGKWARSWRAACGHGADTLAASWARRGVAAGRCNYT